ncbi:LolA family protein [Paenibacillus sp. KN14-4R]|uniref:LolA family protein n=1 Tax=Paenibacillus sp. KN14-4R TaxID=3445773 RepID=UPI003FA15E79
MIRQVLLIGSLAAGLLITGCSQQVGASSTDIVTKALEKGKQVESYSAKGTFRFYDKDKLTEDAAFSEWMDAGNNKKKIEMTSNGKEIITVNDGKQLISYDKANESALTMDIGEDVLPTALTQREQLISMLEKMKKTHSFEVSGEEKVLGKDSYHIKVRENKEKSLMGDMDLWIDQKTWFVLKSTSVHGTIRTEFEYTDLQLGPSFAPDTFILNLPDSVKKTKIGDLAPAAKNVTIPEAELALGKPFLHSVDTGFDVVKMEMNEFKGVLNRNEVTAYYAKGDMPYYELSVFPVTGDVGKLDGEEIQVRGTKGEYLEQIKTIFWDEQGLRYNIMIQHPDVTKEQAIAFIEKMVLTKGK